MKMTLIFSLVSNKICQVKNKRKYIVERNAKNKNPIYSLHLTQEVMLNFVESVGPISEDNHEISLFNSFQLNRTSFQLNPTQTSFQLNPTLKFDFTSRFHSHIFNVFMFHQNIYHRLWDIEKLLILHVRVWQHSLDSIKLEVVEEKYKTFLVQKIFKTFLFSNHISFLKPQINWKMKQVFAKTCPYKNNQNGDKNYTCIKLNIFRCFGLSLFPTSSVN